MKLIKNSNSGFTIIELMIVLTLAGILLAVGIPNLVKMINDNRLISQANSIIVSLNYARNLTVTRAIDVRVEPIVAGTTWTAGWLVRIDGNNDGDFSDTEDTPLKYFEEVNSATLTSSANNIVFEPDGNVTAATTLTLTPETCSGNNVRQISISVTGHSRVEKQSCP